MKKLLLALSAFVLVGSTLAEAQSVPPPVYRASARLTKVTQIGHIASGAAPRFVLKGERAVRGVVTETFNIDGLTNSGVGKDCLQLASSLNTNALAQTSNLVVNFTFEIGGAAGVGGGPTQYTYTKANISSCYLSNN